MIISAIDGSEQVTFVATFLGDKRDTFASNSGNIFAELKYGLLGMIGPATAKGSGLRVVVGKMGMRSFRIVQKEK